MGQEIPPGIKSQIAKFQRLQEELQYVLTMKQQWQAQLYEIENALAELEKVPQDRPVYKIVGSIMVSKDRESIIKELNEKKELIESQLETLKKQEDMLRKQVEDLDKKLRARLGGSNIAG
ncbi:MAG: prefoldin subunit beta [Thermoprotei archaeon]|nr:MAG: prefoldin subunit beta [Thermoprotei archaeon]